MLDGNPIPLIDLSAGLSDEQLAAQVKHAVASVGFLHIKGARITQEQVDRIFKISSELYNSPLEERAACPKDAQHNGHVMYGTSRLNESKGAGDMKEDFVYGRSPAAPATYIQPLPPALERHRAELAAFHAACFELACTILDAFSLALNLPKTYFRDRHVQRTNGLSLINYPAVPAEEASGVAGAARASAHKDWGSLTLLFQEANGTAGLEVFLPDQLAASSSSTPSSAGSTPYLLATEIDQTQGKWYSAPNLPGTVLVNVGLQMEAWTGGLAKATLHRVVPQPAPGGGFQARKSMPYFVQAEESVVLNPVDSEGRIEETAGALTAAEFFQARLDATRQAVAAAA